MMKTLSFVLIVHILLLSSFTRLNKCIAPIFEKSVFHKMKEKYPCHDKKPGTQSDGCTEQGCCLVFNCNLFYFLKVEPLVIKSPPFFNIEKSTVEFKIGSLTDYHCADWKPPKSC